MLCSARPAGKSSSNWLDRLRSNKGIPTGDDLDLDSFLTTTAHSDSPHFTADPTHAPNRTQTPEIPAASSDPPMSSVLAELFDMGGSLSSHGSKLHGKKYPRKQIHPKFFVASSSSSPTNHSDHISIKDDSVPATNSSFNGDDAVEDEEEEEEEEEENEQVDGNELRGFSRSEVTVIDTSCQLGWKVEKLVFRRNNVWKVRERRGKSSRFFAKKKSKATPSGTLVENNNGGGGEHNYKPMVFQCQFGNSSKTNREEEQELITPYTQGQCNQHQRREACKDAQDDPRPPPKKRSPRKSRKENTSVILIKAIPT